MSDDAPFQLASDDPRDPANWQGQGVRRWFTPPSQGGPDAGMRGTQSGPADESDTMAMERFGQKVGAVPAAMGTFLGGLVATENPWIAGSAAAAPYLGLNINAESPNIRDVWADKLRMLLQRVRQDPDTYLYGGPGDQP